ncbi:MAG TPA: protocatechuate 3,4-dioxygenase subunit alpha [Candidatus Acidoferrales bacterium]|nr:protocatechuate 3,4-dioxygenase subunit alpha [Candidatus Acidoferrales bacterium]
MKTRNKEKLDLVPTPSQTVGPYFRITLMGRCAQKQIAGLGARGERVRLICKVFDGEGRPIPDGLIEIWQASADGKYNHPNDRQAKPVDPGFIGFGRQGTDADGNCEFETIKPGRVPGRGKTLQAPHFEVSVFARGVLKRLATRIYFAGDPANSEDPALSLVPKTRRATLLAQPVPGEAGTWGIDIHLSGAKETVFFDV